MSEKVEIKKDMELQGRSRQYLSANSAPDGRDSQKQDCGCTDLDGHEIGLTGRGGGGKR